MGTSVQKLKVQFKSANIGIGGLTTEQWIEGGVKTSEKKRRNTPLVSSPSLPASEAIAKCRQHLISTHVGEEDIEITLIIFIGHNDLNNHSGSDSNFPERLASELSKFLVSLADQFPDLKIVYVHVPPFGNNRDMITEFNACMTNNMEKTPVKVIKNELLKRIQILGPNEIHATDESYAELFSRIQYQTHWLL